MTSSQDICEWRNCGIENQDQNFLLEAPMFLKPVLQEFETHVEEYLKILENGLSIVLKDKLCHTMFTLHPYWGNFSIPTLEDSRKVYYFAKITLTLELFLRWYPFAKGNKIMAQVLHLFAWYPKISMTFHLFPSDLFYCGIYKTMILGFPGFHQWYI